MPIQNILMRDFRGVRKDPKTISKLPRTLHVGKTPIKRNKFISGLVHSLQDHTGKTFTIEQLTKPNDEALEAIFSYKNMISTRAQKPFGAETKGLCFADFETVPFNNQVDVVAPLVLDVLRGFWTRKHTTEVAVEYIREQLKDIELIIIPFKLSARNRLINYLVGIGLDIEVSMVNANKSIEQEIEFLNKGRENARRNRKKGNKATVVTFEVKDPNFKIDAGVIDGLQKSVSRIMRKTGYTKPISIQVGVQLEEAS